MRLNPSGTVLTILVSSLLITSALIVVTPSSATMSQTLPASCGPVGASSLQASYTRVPLYPVVTSRGTVITVTTTSDTISGNVSSVPALLADPGPDGLSLREAITATNNDPGVYTIDFAPSLKGETINVKMGDLPALTGGNVIINGEIGGDTTPDVTVSGSSENPSGVGGTAFVIASSGDTIYGLSIQGFQFGISLPESNPVPAGNIIADTVISNNLMNVAWFGVSTSGNSQGGQSVTWSNTLIQNNTIVATSNMSLGGMRFFPRGVGDILEGTSLLGNTIVMRPTSNNTSPTAGINFYLIGNQTDMVDTLIADNTIQTGGYSDYSSSTFGISVSLGGNYSHAEEMTIEGNSVTMGGAGGGSGIGVSDGQENVPYTYHGYIRDAWILDNTITGPGIQALIIGQPTGGDDSMENIYVLGNDLNMSSGPLTHDYGSVDFFILGASGPFGDTFGNNITNLYLGMNTLILTNPPSPWTAEDIVLAAGAFSPAAYDNLVTGVYIFNNYLEGGGGVGLAIWGGWDGTGPTGGPENVTGNTISHVEVWCNLVPTLPSVPEGGIDFKGAVYSGQGFATNNTVEDILLSNNLVAGTLNAYQMADSNGPGSSGNVVRDIAVSPLNATVTETSTVTSTATSTTTATSTSTAVSTITSTLPPVTTTITGPASTTTSTTSVTTTAGGGVPEFPYQLTAATILTTVLVVSYLLVRHSRPQQRSSSRTR